MSVWHEQVGMVLTSAAAADGGRQKTLRRWSVGGIATWLSSRGSPTSPLNPVYTAMNKIACDRGVRPRDRTMAPACQFPFTAPACQDVDHCDMSLDVDADCAHFPVKWLFHHRWGKKPGKVDGKKIEFITAGGRTTAYVPQLQKLTGTQSHKAVAADPGQVSEDGDAKEAGAEGEDDDLKPRKRVTTSRAARGQQNKNATNAPSSKTNQVQVSEDGGAKEVGADGDDGDDLKPRKRVATSRAARGKQTKNATSAPSRKTGKIAGDKKPSVDHHSKDDVETMEPDKAGVTSNDEHGLDEPTATVHRVSEQGVTRMSSRKKSKPAKYQ